MEIKYEKINKENINLGIYKTQSITRRKKVKDGYEYIVAATDADSD